MPRPIIAELGRDVVACVHMTKRLFCDPDDDLLIAVGAYPSTTGRELKSVDQIRHAFLPPGVFIRQENVFQVRRMGL